MVGSPVVTVTRLFITHSTESDLGSLQTLGQVQCFPFAELIPAGTQSDTPRPTCLRTKFPTHLETKVASAKHC